MKGYKGKILLDENNDNENINNNSENQKVIQEDKKQDKEDDFEALETEQKFIETKKSMRFPKRVDRNSEFIYSHENLLSTKKTKKMKVTFNDKKKSQELERKQIKQLEINTSNDNKKTKFNSNQDLNPIERNIKSKSRKNIMLLNYFKKIRQNVLKKKQ